MIDTSTRHRSDRRGPDGRAFDPTDDLPTGTFAIEASAGTGKTYALAGLATRYLAEGRVSTAELLMVTFTRAATGELRSRVRERLVEAARHLSARLEGHESDLDNDALLDWLASPDAPGGSTADRLGRLESAISEFDAATITTIHGFASQVLGALGVGSGVAGEVTFVDDMEERLIEACSDVLADASVDPSITCELPKWDTFTKRVKQVAGSPDVEVMPAVGDPDAGDADADMAELVRRAVALMRDRRRVAGEQSFDDLLVRLREALRSTARDAGGGVAAATLRGRYRVALIDEFQDTDPVQWEIFRTLFVPGREGSDMPRPPEGATAGSDDPTASGAGR